MNTKTMNTEKNYYETFVDSQKKLIDTMTDATHKFTNNEFVNETIEKSSNLYKNWLDTQLHVMNETAETAKTNPANAEALSATAKTWMETQMALTRDFMDFSMNSMKTYMESLNKNMPALNGSGEQMKNMFETNMKTFQEMNKNMQKQFEGLMTNFKSGDLKNAMSGMFNQTDVYNKFVELWTPFLKSFQNNSFNPEIFTNMMNQNTYQDFINKTFGFGNETFSKFTNLFNPATANDDMWSNWMKTFNPSANPFNPNMQNFMNMFNMQGNPTNDMMKQWMNMFNQNNNPFASMTNQMNNMFSQPMNNMMNMNPNYDMFGNWMNTYNTIYSNLQNTFAPMAKMMTPNSSKVNMDAISAIMNKMNQFMIKQNEMQYVTYTTGMKAMQKVAERMQEKMSKGEDFKGMTALYNEWLNTSDKVFVELFESDEYAKLQAEYASLSHSLKHDTDLLTEKMLANFPVITRTEMDDTYKTIYDLKKRINELEKKQVKNETSAKAATAPKAEATSHETASAPTAAPRATTTVRPGTKTSAKRK